MLFLATLLVPLLAAACRAVDVGFFDSCTDVRFYDVGFETNIYLTFTPYIIAKCSDNRGGERCSWLPLMHCISNKHGNLAWERL